MIRAVFAKTPNAFSVDHVEELVGVGTLSTSELVGSPDPQLPDMLMWGAP